MARKTGDAIRGHAVGGGVRRPVEMVQSSLDGRSYPKPTDDKIDRLVHLVFNNPNGADLMNWLEAITLRTVMPPDASDAQLRDMEGQRRLVAMLKQRSRKAVETR